MAAACIYFNNGKWVNLPENADYLVYLNDMYNCLYNSGYYNYYNETTRAIRNRVDDSVLHERHTENVNNFEPSIIRYINDNGQIDPYLSLYSRGVSGCTLCQQLNVLGFDERRVDAVIRGKFNNVNPYTKKQFLLYKDLIKYYHIK
jgi:hypothetical protein